MVKNKLIKLLCFCIIAISTINCKQVNETSESSNKEIVKNATYKEVAFTKNYKNNIEVSELNINYENYSLKFRFIEDITILQYSVNDKIISDWKQVLFNFQYLSENYEGIRLLFNKENSDGLLLAPGYTEEYPNLIVYNFDENSFKFLNNLDLKVEDSKKIPLEKFNNEWKKGLFEAEKKNKDYTLTFTDSSKKNILNFEITESQELLSNEELKPYIDKVLIFENLKKSNVSESSSSNLSQFITEIEKQGFKNILEKKCDLNQDKINDKIIVYSTSFPQTIETDDYKEFIVSVFISDKLFQNRNIILKYYSDNVATGFNDVKIKDNYFTIEQTNGIGNGVVQEFTTFKYSSNQILLHKYSIIENERSNGDENEKIYTYTTKNFGTILFQDYNIETIKSKCKL